MLANVRYFLEAVSNRQAIAFETKIYALIDEWDIQNATEQFMYIALCHLHWDLMNDYFVYKTTKEGKVVEKVMLRLAIGHAVKIGEFEVNFLVIYKTKKDDIRIVIECDELSPERKTAEERKLDDAKDAVLMEDGYHVLRFSKEEIITDPLECAREAYNLVTD
ncbi:MAG: DUF559 domain-containing protein [Candidatus Omnitrophota bacterium]